jgi:hypothetical protein
MSAVYNPIHQYSKSNPHQQTRVRSRSTDATSPPITGRDLTGRVLGPLRPPSSRQFGKGGRGRSRARARSRARSRTRARARSRSRSRR